VSIKNKYRMEGFCDINMGLIMTLKYVESELISFKWKETGFTPVIPGEIPGSDS
jgi:hypothetical protein